MHHMTVVIIRSSLADQKVTITNVRRWRIFTETIGHTALRPRISLRCPKHVQALDIKPANAYYKSVFMTNRHFKTKTSHAVTKFYWT
jgi:hypothetical protein